MARTHEQFISEVKDRNEKNPLFKIKIKQGSKYSTLDVNMTFECCNGHPDFTTKPRYIIQKGSGCPLCKNKKTSVTSGKGMDEFVLQLSQINPNILIQPKQQYINTTSKLKFKCSEGHMFETLPKSLLVGHGCPICAKVARRKDNYIQSLYYSSNYSIKEFKELTKNIHGIDVELIPISRTYDRRYYLDKLIKNPLSIFVFEDEWESNKELIKRKLIHYSNQSEVIKIHARQCKIVQITNDDKKDLLNNNHVQGNDNVSLAYGAYYGDVLVSIMTFSMPRISVGALKKDRSEYGGIWELSRFCTDTNYRIPGIASKLLTHFKRNNEWTEIYSFADRRWSVGNMYHQLGFDLVATNPPAYFYIVNGQRKHRWNYRKDVLKKTLPNYDAALTEDVNMINHGYWRVWDCGTLKFSMKNK